MTSILGKCIVRLCEDNPREVKVTVDLTQYIYMYAFGRWFYSK